MRAKSASSGPSSFRFKTAALVTPGMGVSLSSTHVIALYEGAAPSAADPFEPGPFTGPVGDPSLLENAEFIRVRWFLYSDPGNIAAVERWELPFLGEYSDRVPMI